MRTPVVVGSALGLLLSAAGISCRERLPIVALLAGTTLPVAPRAYGTSVHGAAQPGAGEGAGQVWLAGALKNLGQPAVGYALPIPRASAASTCCHRRRTAGAHAGPDPVMLPAVLSVPVPVLLVVASVLS